jgi:hypothetical protein
MDDVRWFDQEKCHNRREGFTDKLFATSPVCCFRFSPVMLLITAASQFITQGDAHLQISIPRSTLLNNLISRPATIACLLVCLGVCPLAIAQDSGQEIPSTFFAMTMLKANDFAPLTVGAEGHPPQFLWPFIEKRRGSYDFDIMDPYVTEANNRNIPITLAFGKVPGWEQKHAGKCWDLGSGIKSCPGPPSSLDDWKAFVTAVAQHYKGRVQFYEIWNEVNLPVTFNGSAQELVDLARVAYPLIKSIDPNATVLAPSMGDNPQTETAHWDAWMTNYLQSGGNQYADGGTFHGYTGAKDPEAIIRLIHACRQVMDHNGLRGLPIYNTEGGWGVIVPQGEDNQAAFMARWYILQASLYATDNLRYASWYAWGEPGRNQWGAIQRPDGTPSEAALTFNEVYKWLVGATLPRVCSFVGQDTHHAVWTCDLERSGGYEAQAVWNTSGPSSYRVPKGFTHYRDLAGNSTPIVGRSVTIGLKPILLEK